MSATDASASRAEGFDALAVTLLVVSILSQVGAYACQRMAGLESADGEAVSAWSEPWFFGSLALLTINGVVWPLVLRRVPLSRAFPFMAFIPPLNLAAAAYLLGEAVGVQHALGVVIVAAGVWILAGRKR